MAAALADEMAKAVEENPAAKAMGNNDQLPIAEGAAVPCPA
jgi:hypothetical protein